MRRNLILTLAACAALLLGQSGSKSILVNQSTAKWTHDAGDPPGSESVLLREDPQTGAMELLARYPAGHVFSPHWHTANERILLLEGRISIHRDNADEFLDTGGFAYLPAREPQRMACISKTRCTFYVYWDAKLDFHPVR